MPTAREMAAHLLTLPPASRVNTTVLMRAMRGTVSEELEDLAARLKEHGAKEDLMESRKAFAEKRPAAMERLEHPRRPLPHTEAQIARRWGKEVTAGNLARRRPRSSGARDGKGGKPWKVALCS
jgi:hypothetical protein